MRRSHKWILKRITYVVFFTFCWLQIFSDQFISIFFCLRFSIIATVTRTRASNIFYHVGSLLVRTCEKITQRLGYHHGNYLDIFCHFGSLLVRTCEKITQRLGYHHGNYLDSELSIRQVYASLSVLSATTFYPLDNYPVDSHLIHCISLSSE